MALRPEHQSLEIGWTWIGKLWWRTGANVETKLLLLLGDAFETLGCERVELMTEARDTRSRAVMEASRTVRGCRPPTHEDSRPLARHRLYSIAPEWPDVRATLRRRLARHGVTAYAQG